MKGCINILQLLWSGALFKVKGERQVCERPWVTVRVKVSNAPFIHYPVIVTIGDNRDYIGVLLYSYYTTITGWGVLLIHASTQMVATKHKMDHC